MKKKEWGHERWDRIGEEQYVREQKEHKVRDEAKVVVGRGACGGSNLRAVSAGCNRSVGRSKNENQSACSAARRGGRGRIGRRECGGHPPPPRAVRLHDEDPERGSEGARRHGTPRTRNSPHRRHGREEKQRGEAVAQVHAEPHV
jgi:hypothetical protein